MRTTHDKQIERQIGDSAIRVDTPMVTGANVSIWIPVGVAVTVWVLHIANATITCGIWGVNIFSDGPDIVASRASGFIDHGAEDIAQCFVQSYTERTKEVEKEKAGPKSS